MAVVGTAACTLPWKEKPITIAAILDFSGPNAFLTEMRDGIQLGVDEVNERGGINGRQVRVIFRDCESDPDLAKKEFEDIERDYHPLLYLTSISTVALPLAPLAEKYQVPVVGLGVMSDELTKQNKWVFRYATSTADEVKTAVFMLDYLKIKRVAVLYQDDAYGAPSFSVFREMFEKEGGAAVGQPFGVSDPNLKDIAARYTNERAIYIIGHAPRIKAVIVELKALGYRGTIIGGVGLSTLAATTPEADGTYTAAPIIYNPSYTFAREAQEKLEARYGEKLTLRSAVGYDFIRLLAGLLTDRELTREGTREVLNGWFIYPGLLGNIESEAGDRNIMYPLFPVRIENGAMTYLQ